MTKTQMFAGSIPGTSSAAFVAAAGLHYLPKWLLAPLRARRRSPDFVRANYDAERQRMLDEFHARRTDLESFCLYPRDQRDFRLLGSRISFGELREAAAAVFHELEDALRPALVPGARVLEFGSGFGRNVILLKSRHPQCRFAGLELSPVSVALATEAAKTFGVEAEFVQADATAPAPAWPADLCFTCHALEQMPRIFSGALDNMIATGCREIVLVEPVEELYPWSVRGVVSRMRVTVHDRLRGLLRYIRSQPRLTLVSARRLGDGINPLNESCIVRLAVKPSAT